MKLKIVSEKKTILFSYYYFVNDNRYKSQAKMVFVISVSQIRKQVRKIK